jgi:hypothetical protein
MKKVLYILGCVLVLLLGFLCAIMVGDDGGMIEGSIKSLAGKD